jgi:2-amino-4-hydroxy-6-hydroxymethyldihydropteridine diphosphokinase
VNRAIVGVGSNIEPRSNIVKAKEILLKEQHLVKESEFVTTSPIGFANQPDFINGAFMVDTELPLAGFKAYLKDIETRLGRVRDGNKNGPRTIDLDIIVWNGEIVNGDYYERDFVKKAVEELLGEFL